MESFDLDPAANDGHEPKEKINIMERIVTGTRDGFIGVLFMMSKDTRRNKAFSIVTMVVDAFQLSALATPALFSTELVMHPSLMAVVSIANAFEFTQYVGMAKDTLTTVAVALVAVLLCNVGYVGYSYVRNNSAPIWSVGLLRRIAVVLTGVLYIPLVTALSSALLCDGSMVCESLRPVSAIFLFFFVIFSLSMAAVFYDARNDGVTPVRMPHSRVAVLHKFISTVLAGLAGLLPGMTTANPSTVIHFWAGLLTGCSLVLLFAYVWLQPYYSHRINSMRAMLMAFFLWISVGFLVSDAYTGFSADTLPVPTAVFSVGVACTLPMMRLLISYRRTKLLDPCRRHKLASMFPALDTELKVRLMLEEAQKQQRQQAALSSGHKGKVSEADLAQKVMQEAVAIYSEVSARLNESSQVAVLHSQFLLFELKKPLLARRAMLLAEARSPALDESFVIFKTKKYLEENAFQNNDIMSFVTSEKHLALSAAYDKKCCVLLVHFWKALGDPKMDVNHIRKLSDLITEASLLADDSYKQLIKLRPTDAPILETYAGFVETIGNDPEEARRLELRAQDLKQRQVKTTDSADVGIDASSAILTVDASGKPLENGRVLAANTMAGRLFKQPTDFLVNKAVGTVLLPPFTNGFDDMVANYLEQAEETFFNTPFDTYVRMGMGTDETLLPCRVLVKPFTSDGVDFQMYFSLTELHVNNAEVVLVDPTTLAIVGVTKGLRGLMTSLAPSDADRVGDTPISIEDAIPDYGKHAEAWRGAPAFEQDLAKAVQRAIPGTVSLQVSVVRLHGPTSPALDKITFTLDASHVTTNSDSGSDLEYAAGSESDADSDSDADVDDVDVEDQKEDHPLMPQVDMTRKKSVGFSEAASASSHPKLRKLSNASKAVDKAPSEHGGSSSVGSTGTTTAAAIRRTMLSSRNKLDTHLARFRRLFVYTTALSMLMIIAMYGVRSTSLAAHEADDPSEAGSRRYMAVTISYLAHALVLLNLGIKLPCGLTEEAARAEMMEYANALSEVSNSLYHRQGSFSPALKYFYEERAIALREIGSGGMPTVVDRTMFDASMLIVGNAQKASKMPLEEFTNYNPEVFTLIHNVRHHDDSEPGKPVRYSYLEGLNTTTMVYTYQNSEFLPMMNMAQAIVACIVVFVSIVILIIILLPTVSKIDRTKVDVFHELVGMPKQVFPVVSKRYMQRLELVHGTGSGEEAQYEDADDDEDDDDIDEATMQGTLLNTNNGPEVDTVKAENSKVKSRDRNMNALDEELAKSSVRCRVMTRMSGNILIFILYFATTLFVSFDMQIRVADAPNQSNYGGLRSATLRLASHELRIYATGGDRNGGWALTEHEMDSEFDHLADIHDALVYGDHNRGLHGILHSRDTNVDQEDLMFTHGCLKFKKTTKRPAADIVDCEDYQDGLVSAGLHRGTLSVIALGHFLAHETTTRNLGRNESTAELNMNVAPSTGGHRLRRLLSTKKLQGPGIPPLVDAEHPVDPSGFNHFTPEELNKTLNGPLFVQLCELETYYLQPMLATSIYLYRAQEHMIVDEEEVVQQTSLAILVCGTILLYVFVVQRLVVSLDIEVKRTRGLLLMIPDDILANLSGLRRFLYKEVANQR